MRKIYLICICFLLVWACQTKQDLKFQQEWFDSTKKQVKREFFIKSKEDNIEGVYKEYYLDGTLKLEGTYLDNKKDGKFILYNEQGVKITEQNYSFDKLDSISKDFYPNGKVKLECTYEDGMLNGPMIQFYDNGNPHEIINIEKGLKQGESKLFYPSGIVQASLNYKNGQLNGLVSSYETLGNLVISKFYEGGKQISSGN